MLTFSNMPNEYEENWRKAQDSIIGSNTCKIVDYGWEQHVILDTEHNITYRYPRHDAAAAKLADEVAVLKQVNQLDWAVKLPYMLEHNDAYATYKYVPGEALSNEIIQKLTDDELSEIGKDLGIFLAQFHNLDKSIVEAKQTKQTTSLLEYYENRINNSKNNDFKPLATDSLNKLKADSHKLNPVVVHGDLHSLNVIINPQTKKLTGVIDLSEMEIGDPQQEFRKIFMTFPGALDSSIESYQNNGGQMLNKETIILWAYVNEWANVCHFADDTENGTYKRAIKHLKQWGQI